MPRRVVEPDGHDTAVLVGDQTVGRRRDIWVLARSGIRFHVYATRNSACSVAQVSAICLVTRTALCTVVQSTLSTVSEGRCRLLIHPSSVDSSETVGSPATVVTAASVAFGMVISSIGRCNAAAARSARSTAPPDARFDHD